MAFDPPAGWSINPLERVATLQRGFDLPVQDREEGEVPVYGSNGIDGWHVRAAVAGPGVITGRSGTIGSVYFETRDYWPLNTTLYVRDFHGNEPRFIARLLESLGLQRFSASTGVPSLNRNFVHPTPVLLPPPREQACIAAVLDAVDEAIAKTEAVIAKLKQVRAGLLHDLLTRGLDECGLLRDPISHPEQFRESPLGMIPRMWEVGGVRDLAQNCDSRRVPLKQGDRDNRHGIYPYYGASGIIDSIDDYLFDGEFVLLAEDGENLRSRELPLAIIARGKFWVNNHAHILKSFPRIDIRFVQILLEAQDYTPWLIGSAQPKLTQGGLEAIPLRIPPADEQTAIADTVEVSVAQLTAEEADLSKLKSLKAGLMADLLTGRIRVPEGLA